MFMIKRSHIFISFLTLIIGMLVWWGWTFNLADSPTRDSALVEPQKPRGKRVTRENNTLERVRTAAQRKLPDVTLNQKEDIVFVDIDPRIEELDVMEVLLEIETEFGIDIPQKTISQRVGVEHRRDLRSHLSLSLIAECVDVILQNPER